MTIDDKPDQPSGAGKAIEQTWDKLHPDDENGEETADLPLDGDFMDDPVVSDGDGDRDGDRDSHSDGDRDGDEDWDGEGQKKIPAGPDTDTPPTNFPV